MALEACFQLSTIPSSASPATNKVSCCLSHKEKISLPPSRVSKGLVSSLSSFLSFQQRGQVHFICQAKNAVDGVIAVDDACWDNAVARSTSALILVEFWAPWCGPCRKIEPVIVELAKDYAGKLFLYKVNTDTSPNIATKYGIRSIPTVLFFKNGEKKDASIGSVPESTLSESHRQVPGPMIIP